METMVRLKDVNTGEEIELDLNDINIWNPIEREWDIIEDSKNEVYNYFSLEYKKQLNQLSLEPIVPQNIKKGYMPSIGTVNF